MVLEYLPTFARTKSPLDVVKYIIHGAYGGFLKWWYFHIIRLSRIFHYNPSSYWGPHLWKPPHSPNVFYGKSPLDVVKYIIHGAYGGFLKWWYFHIIRLSRIFHYNPSSYWGTPIYGNPHIVPMFSMENHP